MNFPIAFLLYDLKQGMFMRNSIYLLSLLVSILPSDLLKFSRSRVAKDTLLMHLMDAFLVACFFISASSPNDYPSFIKPTCLKYIPSLNSYVVPLTSN